MVNSIDTLHFPSIRGKPVLAQFNGGQLSSDAGILALKKIDDNLGLTSSLSQCIVDSRQQSKVRQPIIDMVRQRIYGIACGY